MGLAEEVASLLKWEPVGRVYLEDSNGQRVQAWQSAKHREPQIRYGGKVYGISAQLPEGWLYRTSDQTPGTGSDPSLEQVVGPNDPGFVWPSDWGVKPDPEREALDQVSAAITELGRYPGQAARAARLAAAWDAESQG